MKLCLARLVMPVALATLLACGFSSTAIAHDLPSNEYAYRNLFMDCLGTAEVRSTEPEREQDAQRWVCPFASLSSEWALFHRASDPALFAFHARNWLSQLSSRLQEGTGDAGSSRGEAVAIALPDLGRPPRPRVTPQPRLPASRSLAKRRFVEDYMPYDLSIRDWRFGQFSFQGPVGMERRDYVNAEISSAEQLPLVFNSVEISDSVDADTPASDLAPSPEAIALGRFLQSLEEIHCVGAAELIELPLIERASYAAKAGLERAVSAAGEILVSSLMPVLTPSKPSEPLFAEPLYLVYDVQGGLMLVPAVDAKQGIRSAVLAAEPIAGNENWSDVGQSLRSTGQKVLDGLLGVTSRRLETLGSQLIDWSHHINGFTADRLASRSGEVR